MVTTYGPTSDPDLQHGYSSPPGNRGPEELQVGLGGELQDVAARDHRGVTGDKEYRQPTQVPGNGDGQGHEGVEGYRNLHKTTREDCWSWASQTSGSLKQKNLGKI